MKIAVCFFGITRNLKQNTLASIEQNLLAPVSRMDPNYKRFGHFNFSSCITNPRTGEDNVRVDPCESVLLNCDVISHTDQYLLDLHLKSEFLHLQQFGDSWNDNFGSLMNLLRQFHSLNQVTDHLDQFGQTFDVVIFSRADLRFEHPVEIPVVRTGTIYTPWFGKYRGLNDRFAIGDFKTMQEYGRRGGLAKQYCAETGQSLHSERFLLWCMRQRNVRNVDLTTSNFCIVRANGSFRPVDTSLSTKCNYRFKQLLRRLKLHP